MTKKQKNNRSLGEHGYALMAAMLLFVAMALFSCGGNDNAQEHDTYTCPMHPTVISDRPGTCPVCGMDLVRKARPGEEVEITEELSKLIKSPNEVVISDIRTTRPEYKKMPLAIKTRGVVTYDTRRVGAISARVEGRIEKLYVTYESQQVKKGQKIADLYSPPIITAQRELLFLSKNDPSDSVLIEAARARLRLLGVSDAAIRAMEAGELQAGTYTVYSPYSGYVIADGSAPPSIAIAPADAGSMGDEMSSTSSPAVASAPAASSNPRIKEGAYVGAGQTLFRIVNNEALRVDLSVSAAMASTIARGDEVALRTGGQVVDGTVDFVQPFVDEGQEFTILRVFVSNPGTLRIGQVVDGEIRVRDIEALWLPREAVVDLGREQVVFVLQRGVFRPKTVSTGARSNGHVQIIAGLASSDEVASNAQYLVDSESFIK